MESESSNEYILSLDYIENLESSLNYPIQFNVHIEFCDNLLNEDVIITILDNTGKIDIEVPLNFPLQDIYEYNNFASHPMLIYFESLNEIKQNALPSTNYNSNIKQTWVCIVDLLPLVYDTSGKINRNTVGGQYPMKAIGELNRNLLSDAEAQLNAIVSFPEMPSLFHASSPPVNNVLDITVHGLYNPPSLGDNPHHRHEVITCSAMLDIPMTNETDFQSIVFAHGTFTDITRDVNDRRWHSLDNMPATVSATGQRCVIIIFPRIHMYGHLKPICDQYRWSRNKLKGFVVVREFNTKFLSYCRLEEYNGTVVNSAKIPKPKDVLFKGPRFEWNLWRRFLMSEMSSRTFQEFIFKHRYLPITFTFSENPMITNKTMTTDKRTKKNMSNTNVSDDEVFVAFLDLSVLLQPNCTSVRCLSIIHTALDAETLKHNGLSLANFDTIDGYNETNMEDDDSVEFTTSSFVTSNNASVQMTIELPFAVVDISVTNSFYDQYVKYLTSSLLEINLILENPKDTIYCTPMKSNKYQEILNNTIEKLMKTKINEQNDIENYVSELKVSGAYESMQSSLCDEIRLYIKENYGGPSIGETVQGFVNRIYMDLVSKMKKTVESFEFPHSSGAECVKPTRAIVYAREADELKQTERAKTFYLDLISASSARCNPNYWLLYASFCSRRLDFDTALEYVKEVLLVDSGNRIGLFLYAAIQLTVHEDNNNGEIVLKSLIMSHGDFSEAYALLSVHYSIKQMYEAAYIMLRKAEESLIGEIENNSIIHENHISWQPIGHNNDPLIKCAILLLEFELVKLATHCLNLVKLRCEKYHYYMAVCEYKNGDHLASLKYLKNGKIKGKYKNVISTLKCLNSIELNEPQFVLENYLIPFVYAEAPCRELHLVYLKGILLCYENKWYAKGVEICQVACTVLRTPMIYILLAKCLMEIGEVETAESALNEANFMDIKNEEVWAYLNVVNIEMGNTDEAKVCYTRALECGLKPEMKEEIDTLFGKKNDILIL